MTQATIKPPESEVRLTSDYDFDLPARYMGFGPVGQRGEARLMVVHRETGRIEHREFKDVREYLGGRPVYINDSHLSRRWVALRRMPGYVENFYFIEALGDHRWRTFSTLGPGTSDSEFRTRTGVRAAVFPDAGAEHRWIVQSDAPIDIEMEGRYCVPPDFLLRPTLSDRPMAQALYAREPGSFAAPTAGIHLTEELLGALDIRRLTLHTGPGSFYEVKEESPAQHRMEPEEYRIPEPPAVGEKVVAVGTTTAKALEAWARTGDRAGRSDLFIYPPFEFQAVGALLTNLHRPRESLLMMTCALAGYELVMEAHRQAVTESYRFSYYGDLMLIL